MDGARGCVAVKVAQIHMFWSRQRLAYEMLAKGWA